jgi:hypothetical protein
MNCGEAGASDGLDPVIEGLWRERGDPMGELEVKLERMDGVGAEAAKIAFDGDRRKSDEYGGTEESRRGTYGLRCSSSLPD